MQQKMLHFLLLHLTTDSFFFLINAHIPPLGIKINRGSKPKSVWDLVLRRLPAKHQSFSPEHKLYVETMLIFSTV